MALSRWLPLSKIKVIATDLDEKIIEKAKIGLYSEKSIVSVPEDLKSKFFLKIGSKYKISDDIKSRVEFRKHDLLKDSYPEDCHLILCRNVVIYFTEEAKSNIFQKFYNALTDKGVLFVGSTEQIMNFREIGFERKGTFFYSK